MEDLVSIYVVAYNSSAFILETLDSIKKQTYSNIELIVSDDASSDDTVAVCRKWIRENECFFKKVILLTSEVNTGVSANCNRAVKVCSGKWLKCIAGDDRLLENCITSNMDFVKAHPKTDILFSKVIPFGEKINISKWPFRDCSRFFEQFSAKEMLILLCQGKNFLPAPCAFVRKKVYDKIGGFDENIPFLEDRPFWIKALYLKAHFEFNPVDTVEYRFSPNSISQTGEKTKTRLLFEESFMKASKLGIEYLKKVDVFAYFYCLTTYNSLKPGKFIWTFVHSLNIFNPFYYLNLYCHKKYNKLCHIS